MKYPFVPFEELLRKAASKIEFQAGAFDHGLVEVKQITAALAKISPPDCFITISCLSPESDCSGRFEFAVTGVKKHLGIENADYSIGNLFQVVTPPYCQFLLECNTALYAQLNSKGFRTKLANDVTFSIPLLVQLQQRSLIHLVRKSQILSDDRGELLPFQVNFHLLRKPVGNWRSLVPKIEFSHSIPGFFSKESKLIRDQSIPSILASIKSALGGKALLTPRQAQIAKSLCDSKDISAIDIANNIEGTTKANIYKHNSNILNRMRMVFPHLTFAKAQEAAAFADQSYLLDYLLPGTPAH